MQENKKRKNILIILIAFILVMTIGGVTYAFFNYRKIGGVSEIVVGDIYFHHQEGNTINLQEMFPMDAETARARNDNEITFSVTGDNEAERDIYYKLMLEYGDNLEGERIRDDLVHFDLVEVTGVNQEKYIIYDEGFNTITNAILTKDRIDAGTSNTITRTYKLRMWISDSIVVGNKSKGADYSLDEWDDLYANVKVTVRGKMEDVKYYSSFSNAITAINTETYVSETDRENAKLGIYVDSDDSSTNLVLYDDVSIDAQNSISKPVDINLYGNTMTYQKVSGVSQVNISGTADFIIENGNLVGAGTFSSSYAYGIFVNGEVNVKIKNINWHGNNLNYLNLSIFALYGANIMIENCELGGYDESLFIISSQRNSNILVKNTNAYGYFHLRTGGVVQLNDSSIYSQTPKNTAAVNIGETSTLIVNNSTIFADSPGCYINGETYSSQISNGIHNNGTLIFNSGYVFGTHSAVQTNPGSKTYVYGGTFESTDHGGFYFIHGSTGIAYIENANINGSNYPASGRMRPNGAEATITENNEVYTLEEAQTAFYIGGDTNQNGETVYMVNCHISSVKAQVFVMRQSTPVQNLYLSGCSFTSSAQNPLFRIDHLSSMRLYLGVNNSIGNISGVHGFETANSDSRVDKTIAEAKEYGTIVETNTDYWRIFSPDD